MKNCVTYKKIKDNSQLSTKNFFKASGLIDDYLNIIKGKLSEFRQEVTKQTEYAKTLGVDVGRLYSERTISNQDTSYFQAVPNIKAFAKIDSIKKFGKLALPISNITTKEERYAYYKNKIDNSRFTVEEKAGLTEDLNNSRLPQDFAELLKKLCS